MQNRFARIFFWRPKRVGPQAMPLRKLGNLVLSTDDCAVAPRRLMEQLLSSGTDDDGRLVLIIALPIV